MESRNLFSYTVRLGREDKNRSTDVFDPNGYTVETLSPDLKAEKDKLYDMWLEAKKTREERESIVCSMANCLSFLLVLLCLLLIRLLLSLIPDTQLSDILRAFPFLVTIILSWVFHTSVEVATRRFAHRLYVKKHPETDVDEKALDPRLSETVAAARAELGVPHHAWELDILPYRHGVTSVGEAYEIRPLHVYDNIPVSVWREGQVLYLSDEDVVMRLPLSEITEVKRVKKRVKFESWYKSSAVDQEPYKAERVDQGIAYYICKSRIEILLRDGSCLLIPGYEATTLNHILGDVFAF